MKNFKKTLARKMRSRKETQKGDGHRTIYDTANWNKRSEARADKVANSIKKNKERKNKRLLLTM